MNKYITYKNAELLIFILFTGFSVALHTLWPACSVVLAMVGKQALTDYFNYKTTDSQIIQSAQLRAELDEIRQSHKALSQSTETVNTQLKSLQTAISMVGTNRGR